MKSLFVLFLILWSSCASAIKIKSLDGKINIDSYKVVNIMGVIRSEYTASMVATQVLRTMTLPGDRIVVINSPGGSVEEGEAILQILNQEKADYGTRIVCVVTGNAMSEAFNILSACDVRLATSNAELLFHPLYVMHLDGQLNPVNLKKIADELKKEDAPMKARNRKALHMSSKDYDKYGDEQRVWSAKEMLKMKYLSEIVWIE